MTHVDDLHEPGDDREPEPCEWYPAPEPVDLDDLAKLLDLASQPGGLPAWGQMVYLQVPGLIAELREARQRIAEWEALPTREEWAVTENDSTPPRAETVSYFTAEGAMRAAAKHGVQAWRQIVTTKPVVVRPWEPIDGKAPF